MAKYRAWFIHQRVGSNLQAFLAFIGAAPDLDPRPRISLRRVDQSIRLVVSEPQSQIFDKIPRQGDSLRCVTSAPYEEVEFFHNRVLQVGANRYRILCDAMLGSSNSTYMRRFLAIENYSVGLAYYANDGNRVIAQEPEGVDLWLNPEEITLEETHVAFCFKNRAVEHELSDSFLLPPTLILDDEDPEVEYSERRDISFRTYFQDSLVDLRSSILKLLAQPPVSVESRSSYLESKTKGIDCLSSSIYDPTVLTMLRLCDEPLLRDYLLDGGSLQLEGDEGQPTRLVLRVESGGEGAEAFRARFILEPLSIGGPAWAKALASAVRSDVAALLPNNGLEITPSKRAHSWKLRSRRVGDTNHTGGRLGAWTYLDQIRHRIPPSALAINPTESFWYFILKPGEGTPERPDPDHNLAELLFIDQAWRPPWEYEKIMDDPWREALREVLAKEFGGGFLSAEERVEQWNLERNTRNFRYRSGKFKGLEDVAFVSYSGPLDRDSVLLWRLLLPWRSIVSARTVILNQAQRSTLNGRFVLA